MLKAGDVAAPVFERVGDYDRWFAPALRVASVSSEVILAHRGMRLAQRLWKDGGDGILVTGSPLSLTEPSPWMTQLAFDLREHARRGIPILGVCFGHQLLSLAYGTPVIRSPRGREIGTIAVRLTAAGRSDALFRDVPLCFAAQATHEDVPAALPLGAVALATNSHGLQAMALGDHVRGIQFHPELSAEGMLAVIQARAVTLEREAHGLLRPGERVAQLRSGVRQALFGKQILHNFLTRFL